MSSVNEEQLKKEFRRIDKDDDGSITVEELKKYYMPMQEMLGVAPQVAEQEIRGLLKRDRKSTRLNSSHITPSRMPSSA